MKRFFKEQLFPVVMIIIGAACAAFSIECFLIPNTILDGGVTGVSMMISYLSGIRLSILVIVINIPFFFVGYKALGKRFLLRAVIAMAAFSGFLEVCKLIPTVTSSELLAVVFGGVLLGIGVGTVLRHGGCLDGTEIAAMLLSKNVSASTGQIIFMINIFIYITAGILFGWDRAMLSLLTYFITFKLIDIVQEGMIGLYKAIRDYREEKLKSFRAFAELCITRQIITAIKTATRQKHIPLNNYVSLNRPIYDEDSDRTLLDVITEEAPSNPEEMLINREDLSVIEGRIGQMLSDLEKEVLVRYMEGKSYVEISEEMGRHVKSIDNALQRIKRKLLKYLEQK